MILAIDTSGLLTAVAVAAPDGTLIAGGVGSAPRAHAEDVARLTQECIAGSTLDRVVVGRGPGSFAGLRVGLAFGQIYAWAAGLPITGMCSLDVVATQFDLQDGWAVTDARRGELFAARYEAGTRIGTPTVLSREQAAEDFTGHRVVGDVSLLGEPDRRRAGQTTLEPEALARAATRAAATDPDATLQPDYLRRPDVTMSPGNRSGGV